MLVLGGVSAFYRSLCMRLSVVQQAKAPATGGARKVR